MTTNLNVLLVSYMYPPFVEMGGPPLKIRSMAEGLRGRGHDVTVLTANHGRGGRVNRRTNDVDAVYLRSLAHYHHVPFTSGVVSFCARRLDAFDIVHIFGLYDPQGPVVSAFCRRRRVPYVVEPIGMFRPIVRSLVKKRLFHAAFGAPELRGASRVVATSADERAELEAGGIPASKVTVRRNGIGLRPFEALPPPGKFRKTWGIEPDELLTMFLGRIATKKHPELLLRSFATLDRPRGKLVFVGPDEDSWGRRLNDEMPSLGIDPAEVVFAGPVFDEQDKVQALVDADVFVLASESENFGNSVAEAMAAGTPVVVTDRCGISEFVGNRAGIVIPLEQPALDSALARLASDADLRRTLGRGALGVAGELSWDEPLDETEQMYARVIEESASLTDVAS